LVLNIRHEQWTARRFSEILVEFSVDSDNVKVSSIHEIRNRNVSYVHEVERISIMCRKEYLPSNIGSFLPNLLDFYVIDTNLTFLRRENFKSMEKLKSLRLVKNLIEELDEHVFSDLTDLKELFLNENRLKMLPSTFFSQLRRLERFSAEFNGFDSILSEKFFDKSKNLLSIWVNHNYLKSIKFETLKFLVKLTDLEFSSNQITQLDENTFNKNDDLVTLAFGRNEIKVLPKKLLWRLVKLTYFYANENQIESIDPEFFIKNKAIQEIILAGNNLKIISVDFMGFENIIELDFEDNKCIDMTTTGNSTTTVAEVQHAINNNCTLI